VTLFGYTVIKQSALDNLRRVLAEEQEKSRRTLFLLQNGTLRDAPKSRVEAMNAVTKYVYINPLTAHNIGLIPPGVKTTEGFYIQLLNKPTKWILTDLMPEGTAIHTNSLWE